ncbi:hypothetical protein [Acinetobacter junii]|uniref:hypothetical protein n=1 Tax=Acinetobacter junii TaxID=40215 RepID=UPI001F1C0AAA|nr:hypothetical protein [Acinetobacter junii]
MSAINFIKQHGVDKAREVVKCAPKYSKHVIPCLDGEMYFAQREDGTWFKYSNGYGKWLEYFGKCNPLDLAYELSDIKRLVKGVDLINSVGGLTIAKKITFQKRLRNEKATHFIQHPENQKLIQLFVRNQSKPEAAIKFDLLEQAIADYEAIYES